VKDGAMFMITHIREILPGDEMKLGKRHWRYVGSSEGIPGLAHEQAETVWVNISPSPGATDRQRIMSWSEIEDLLRHGIRFTRICTIQLNENMGCRQKELSGNLDFSPR
jgi:hypothetical protein